jgi:predicted chitinase
MAKIPTTRLNNAPVEYNSTSFDLLIEDLNYIVQFLNSTFPKDQEDEEDRKIWFNMGSNG